MSEFKIGQRIWLTGKILGFDDELQLIHIRTDTGWVTTVTYDTVAQEVTAEQAEPLGTCGASETPHTEDACFKQCHRVKHWKPLPVPQEKAKLESLDEQTAKMCYIANLTVQRFFEDDYKPIIEQLVKHVKDLLERVHSLELRGPNKG